MNLKDIDFTFLHKMFSKTLASEIIPTKAMSQKEYEQWVKDESKRQKEKEAEMKPILEANHKKFLEKTKKDLQENNINTVLIEEIIDFLNNFRYGVSRYIKPKSDNGTVLISYGVYGKGIGDIIFSDNEINLEEKVVNIYNSFGQYLGEDYRKTHYNYIENAVKNHSNKFKKKYIKVITDFRTDKKSEPDKNIICYIS